jgi:hypothetical protein
MVAERDLPENAGIVALIDSGAASAFDGDDIVRLALELRGQREAMLAIGRAEPPLAPAPSTSVGYKESNGADSIWAEETGGD